MEREKIISILCDYKRDHAHKYGILAIGVFGSVARGQAGENSDVDICIKLEKPDPFALVHIREGIERRVHAHVDIVRVRENMNPYLRQRIEKDAIYV